MFRMIEIRMNHFTRKTNMRNVRYDRKSKFKTEIISIIMSVKVNAISFHTINFIIMIIYHYTLEETDHFLDKISF